MPTRHARQLYVSSSRSNAQRCLHLPVGVLGSSQRRSGVSNTPRKRERERRRKKGCKGNANHVASCTRKMERSRPPVGLEQSEGRASSCECEIGLLYEKFTVHRVRRRAANALCVSGEEQPPRGRPSALRQRNLEYALQQATSPEPGRRKDTAPIDGTKRRRRAGQKKLGGGGKRAV